MKRLAIILILGIIINVVVIDRLHTLMNVNYSVAQVPRDADNDRLSVRLLSGLLVVADGALVIWMYKLHTRPKPKPKL